MIGMLLRMNRQELCRRDMVMRTQPLALTLNWTRVRQPYDASMRTSREQIWDTNVHRYGVRELHRACILLSLVASLVAHAPIVYVFEDHKLLVG